jgi:hypothetical protein
LIPAKCNVTPTIIITTEKGSKVFIEITPFIIKSYDITLIKSTNTDKIYLDRWSITELPYGALSFQEGRRSRKIPPSLFNKIYNS